MNHEYISIPNSTEDKCIECGYPEGKHGDNAPCDCCDKTGNLEPYLLGNSQALLTRDCRERERLLLEKQVIERAIAHQDPVLQEQRLAAYKAVTNPYDRLIQEAKKLDDQLHLDSDIFTAKTISIEEVRKSIWANPDIPQDKKFFEYVAFCKQRIRHLSSVIFDLDKKKIEVYSEQKAWHVSMNDYANKLRHDEREQLHIQDVTYDVKMPKPVTPKAIKTKVSTADDKKRLRSAVMELNNELVGSGKDGIQEFTVTMIMTSKNWDLDKTIAFLRRSLKEGMSESTTEVK